MKNYEWKEKSYKDYIKGFIAEKLEEYEGSEVIGAELSDYLMEDVGRDETLTYNTAESMEFIKHFYYDIGDVYEKIVDEFDKEFLKDFNPFLQPEKFQVLIVSESVRDVLANLEFINENWDSEIGLNEENIRTIRKEMGLEKENDWLKDDDKNWER